MVVAHAARMFGGSRDFDIDLSDEDRPGLITRLLAACLTSLNTIPDGEDIAWEWTIEQRLQGLIAIAAASCPAPPPLQLTCRADGCGCFMEIELAPAAFAEKPREDTTVRVNAGEQQIVVRLPRGSDQRLWREGQLSAVSLAARLIENVDGQRPKRRWVMPQVWLGELETALAERDSLTVLQLNAACPDCGHVNVVDFDLEGWLLRLLAKEQSRFLDGVHVLASAYGWDEDTICALPPWRRDAYLARLARETRP
jgi:hypothetical protein